MSSSCMSVFADSAKIVVSHEQILQGEPLMVTIQNTNIKDIIFDGKQIPFFLYLSLPTAFIGIDLNAKQGEHTLQVSLRNGETLIQSVIVSQREKIDAPLGIPEKLGGNTQESQKKLVVSLAKENDILNTVVRKNFGLGNLYTPYYILLSLIAMDIHDILASTPLLTKELILKHRKERWSML
jgi:hypothetical protein